MDAEDYALLAVAKQVEQQRIDNRWRHLMRTAVFENIPKVFVAVALEGHRPMAVSLDADTAKALMGNLDSCIKILEGKLNVIPDINSGGGNPPPETRRT